MDRTADKKALRALLRERRAEAAAVSLRPALALRDVFLASAALVEGAVVSAYILQESEMDPAPLVRALHARGHAVCLPCTPPSGKPLIFRSYSASDALRTGSYGIPEPLPSSPALDPDVLLVPVLGFDRMGRRLGQGGGFYDRTLAALRARKTILAIGLAYAAQELPEVPVEAHDQKLDLIVTEKELIDPSF